MLHIHTYTYIHTFVHTPCTHSYAGGAGSHARWQPAHRDQLGVQYLAQGHLDRGQAEQCTTPVAHDKLLDVK